MQFIQLYNVFNNQECPDNGHVQYTILKTTDKPEHNGNIYLFYNRNSKFHDKSSASKFWPWLKHNQRCLHQTSRSRVVACTGTKMTTMDAIQNKLWFKLT